MYKRTRSLLASCSILAASTTNSWAAAPTPELPPLVLGDQTPAPAAPAVPAAGAAAPGAPAAPAGPPVEATQLKGPDSPELVEGAPVFAGASNATVKGYFDTTQKALATMTESVNAMVKQRDTLYRTSFEENDKTDDFLQAITAKTSELVEGINPSDKKN